MTQSQTPQKSVNFCTFRMTILKPYCFPYYSYLSQ